MIPSSVPIPMTMPGTNEVVPSILLCPQLMSMFIFKHNVSALCPCLNQALYPGQCSCPGPCQRHGSPQLKINAHVKAHVPVHANAHAHTKVTNNVVPSVMQRAMKWQRVELPGCTFQSALYCLVWTSVPSIP